MSWLAELRTAALLGTGRHEPPSPPGDLGFQPPDGLSREESLLDQAALADVVTRALRRASSIDRAIGTADRHNEAAPPDDAPEVSGDAARLLELLLTQPPVGLELRAQLVTDWLQLATESRRRVPHRLLPALLTLAKTKRGIAEHLYPAIGARGRWLQDIIRPEEAAVSPGSVTDWAELGSADAAVELERLRLADPGAARRLLRTQWETFSTRERAAHLGTFATNIQAEDEDLLEKALDDKAKSVREVAASLLDRLPTSARASRMAARLRPLLRVKGLLRKQFEIDLPPDPDAAALRDGIAPDPRTGEPDRLGRLDTIIRGAPLDVWTTVTGRSPAATLALLEGETRVINAILDTAVLRADLDWVRALFSVRKDARLLNCLPHRERELSLVRYIRDGANPLSLVPLLRDMPRPWARPLAEEVLKLVTAKNAGQLAAMLAGFLSQAIPLDLADQCRGLLERSDEDAARRRVLRDVVQYQSFRQSLTEAFP
ncbi:DUF5691 domain-containing protein [Arthrobacter rhizosphaerae]|uniref:DUF5691 domain-containing protein n=1 Tax=Arthrobacter rhizosphaerae TaxID=2855490 RepID=UPI001FF68AD9|nr:DUF5691 domain-containing protein [Arthrobacter rhizosphaerae]